MKLGIFGRATDALTLHTAKVARARGHDVVEISFQELLSRVPASFDGSSWLWHGATIESCDAFVVRRYPSVTAQLGPPDENVSGRAWWLRGKLQEERASFAQSAIMDMELLGKPMVNPLLASSPYDHKPLQLATFERAGLPIPRTLVTNQKELVDALRDELVGEIVAKPVAGGAKTEVVDDELLDKLAPHNSPAIFQERIRGDDVRVTVVGDQVVSAVVVEGDDVDYRSAEVHYVAHELPDDARALCVKAAGLCHHVLSGIDLKRRWGEYVLLEANSAPVYLDIERATGAPITEAVVAWLEGRARSGLG